MSARHRRAATGISHSRDAGLTSESAEHRNCTVQFGPTPFDSTKENVMEFLVELVTNVPEGTSEATVEDTVAREAVRAAELASQGHLVRLWKPPVKPGEWRTFGLFAADDEHQLDEMLESLPLHIWMTTEPTPFAPHPNNPAAKRA